MLACGALFIASFLLQPAAVKAQWTTPDASQNINNTNTGNVGIGTTTPTALLEIKKSQNAGTNIIVDNPFTTASNSAFSVLTFKQSGVNRFHIASINDNNTLHFGGPGTVQFWNFANAPMLFSTNNTERMRINAGGKIGINTTAVPTAQLHIMTPSAEGEALRLHRDGNTPAWGVAQFFALNNSSGTLTDYGQISGGITSNTAGSESGVLAFYTRNSGTLAERVRFASNGDVGVGTTTPGAKLHVVGGIYSSSYVEAFYNTGFRLVVSGPGDPRSSWTYDGGTTTARLTSVAGVKTSLGSNAINDRMVLDLSGNVGIATASPTEKLHVTGNIKVSGNIDVGGNINAKYQDVAEWVESSQQLTAGTVVVLDPDKNNQVVASTQSYDSRVAGVISVQPGIALGEHGEGRVLVAATGRVKVKVDAGNGPIKIGDLLVTSDKEGVAMKSVPVKFGGVRLHRPGTLIGKALEPLANGTGEILVLLSLQ